MCLHQTLALLRISQQPNLNPTILILFFSLHLFTRPPVYFFCKDTATTEIYTLSLHDALPIFRPRSNSRCCGGRSSRRSARAFLSGSRPKDRKSTRLNSSHGSSSYAIFRL